MVGMTPLPSTCPHLIFFAPLLSMLFVGGGWPGLLFGTGRKFSAEETHHTGHVKPKPISDVWPGCPKAQRESKAKLNYYGKGTRRQHYKSHPFCKINPLLEEGLLKEAVTDDKLQGNNQLGTLPWINSQSQNNGPADLVAKAALQSSKQSTNPTNPPRSQPASLASEHSTRD